MLHNQVKNEARIMYGGFKQSRFQCKWRVFPCFCRRSTNQLSISTVLITDKESIERMRFPEFIQRQRFCRLLVLLLLGTCWVNQVMAQANAPRMALLIGNSTYGGEWPQLRNATNDAQDLGQKLAQLGWQTTVTTNRTLDNMMDDVQNFVERAQRAKAGQLLLYFSGHGLEWERGAFLIPVDLSTAEGQKVSYKAMSLQKIVSDLQRAPGLKLIMIDACRTRPGAKGQEGGLPNPEAKEPLPSDVLVAYASEAMQAASDGVVNGQRNGVYASGLLMALNQVSKTGAKFNDVMATAEDEVRKLSRGQQNPKAYVSLSSASRFEFAAQPAASKPTLVANPIPVQTPSSITVLLHGRYQILGDGSELKDTQTDLIWARCSLGQRWDGSRCMGEAQIFTFAKAQKLVSSSGWHVPNIRELHSLVWCSTGRTKYIGDPKDGEEAIKHWCDGDYNSPTIQSDVFPQTPSNWFWSSSPYVGDADYAWGVNFGTGYINNVKFRYYNGHVRLVR